MTPSSTSEPENETESAAKTAPAAETVPIAEPVAESSAEPAAVTQAAPIAVTQAQPGEQTQVEPGKQTQVEPGKQTQVEPGKQTQVEPGKQAQVEPGEQAQVEVLGDDEQEWSEDDYDEVLGAEPTNRYPTLIPLIGSLAGLTAIAVLMVVAFALPAVNSTPKGLPIGVSGSTEFQAEVKSVLSAADVKPFTITGYSNESKLRSAIKDRTVYGGLNLDPTSGVSMLISSASSPIAASTLTSLANSLASGGQIPVTDVVKLPESDARGEGLAATNVPLVMAAILPALLLIPIYRRRTAARLGVTAGAAVVVGLGLSAVLDYALGSTDGSNFLLVSVGLMAGVLATSVLLLGLFAVAGRIGVGVGAVLLVFFAAPLSGLSTAPEWLPQPWGDVGQLLPAGANASLLRSTAYFDGRGGAGPALVLLVWALIGLLLIGLGGLIARSKAQQPVLQPEPLTVTL
jgi:hypothetical protein